MASIDWLTVLVSAAINTPAVGALLGWLVKRRVAEETVKHNQVLEELRAKYSVELEAYKSDLEKSKQMLQAEIEKTVLVTKVHFETEFDALKRVFARLAEIRPRISDLRPSTSIVPVDDTPEAKKKRLYDKTAEMAELYNNLVTDSENLSPFYPAEIYAEIAKCRIAVSSEIDDISLTTGEDGFTTRWFARGRTNKEQFLAAYMQVSGLIRERIAKLGVVRGS